MKKLVALIIGIFIIGLKARAGTIWDLAAANTKQEPALFYALALNESKRPDYGHPDPWPWTLNVLENGKWKPYFYKNKKQAVAKIRKEMKKGNDWIDVGVAQINIHYNGHYISDPVKLLEPAHNLYVAGKVIADCEKRHDFLEDILACYASGKPDKRGLAYADRVMNTLDKIQASKSFAIRNRNSRLRSEMRSSAKYVLKNDQTQLIAEAIKLLKSHQASGAYIKGVTLQ